MIKIQTFCKEWKLIDFGRFSGGVIFFYFLPADFLTAKTFFSWHQQIF